MFGKKKENNPQESRKPVTADNDEMDLDELSVVSGGSLVNAQTTKTSAISKDTRNKIMNQ